MKEKHLFTFNQFRAFFHCRTCLCAAERAPGGRGEAAAVSGAVRKYICHQWGRSREKGRRQPASRLRGP